MNFLRNRWRRIGVRLYLALGFAVALTLISGAVGVYYFEQSGDHNYKVKSESVPTLEQAWTAARETQRLQNFGLGVVAQSESGFQGYDAEAIDQSLVRMTTALEGVNAVPELRPDAQTVSNRAHDLVSVIDNLAVYQVELQSVNQVAADFRLRLATTTSEIGESEAALSVLRQVLQAEDEEALRRFWDQFSGLYAMGIDPAVASLGEGDGVFFVRRRQLVLNANIRELASSFETASVALDSSVANLLAMLTTSSTEYPMLL